MAKPERLGWLTWGCWGMMLALCAMVGTSGLPLLCLLSGGVLITVLARDQRLGILQFCAVFCGCYVLNLPNSIGVTIGFFVVFILSTLVQGYLFAWLPALLIALPLTYFSGGSGSASGWADYLMTHFGWTYPQADFAVLAIRKSIHFSYYGLIGLGAWYAMRNEARRIVLVLSLLLGIACFDEVRQTFTPGRTGKFEDVLIDLAGVAVFVVVAEKWSQRRKS